VQISALEMCLEKENLCSPEGRVSGLREKVDVERENASEKGEVIFASCGPLNSFMVSNRGEEQSFLEASGGKTDAKVRGKRPANNFHDIICS